MNDTVALQARMLTPLVPVHAGPGGYVAAIKAAQLGQKVSLKSA